MKGLLSILGLVIALFISSFARADIYSQVSYQPPKRDSSTTYSCYRNGGSNLASGVDLDTCLSILSSDSRLPKSPEEHDGYPDNYFYIDGFFYFDSDGDGQKFWMGYVNHTTICYWDPHAQQNKCDSSEKNGYFGWASNPKLIDSSTCPPDEFPAYIYEKDDNGDGKADRCFNPMELDNASQCQNTVGSMLPALTNTASSVCVTDPTTGARCGFSRSNMGNSYQANLEMSCFGNDEIPEYTDEPMPEPETCTKMNSNLMVCVADPNEKCDFYGVCQDDCGYVNGQFYCFTPCVGSECDAETPPDVDCSATPDHPSCVPSEPEIPENCTKSGAGLICKEDPADKCDEQGVCQDGCGYINGTFVCYQSPGSGGGLFDINIQPIVDELKALNKKFDFNTTDKEGRSDWGSFDDLFGEEDMQKLRDDIASKKEEVTDFMEQVKAEFSSLFSVSSTGGSYDDLTLHLSYGDFTPKFWEFFTQWAGIVGAVIILIAYLTALKIILGDNK
ncbi:hypothetical protein [Shewanella algae]|uniref:hypothetical protein n=1 Tax=Shewanella algae TaxID=38313 RepID=UPI001F35DA2D|nr:hypothetical protein [Shewanella algae]MCE9783716.1 hypothetical protein [Shewanella algae]